MGVAAADRPEATAVIGAERWERTATRTAERNGTRPWVLATVTGDEWVIARRYLTDTSMAQLHASRQTDPVHVVELAPGA